MAIKSESRLSVGHSARPFNEETGYHSWGRWQLQQFLYRYHSCSFSPWSYQNKWNKTSQTNVKTYLGKANRLWLFLGSGGRWRQEEQSLVKNARSIVEFVEFSRPTVELWSSRKEWENQQPNLVCHEEIGILERLQKGRTRKHGSYLAPNRDCFWAEGSILHVHAYTRRRNVWKPRKNTTKLPRSSTCSSAHSKSHLPNNGRRTNTSHCSKD